MFKKNSININTREQRCYELADDILKVVLNNISEPSAFGEIYINEEAGTIYHEDNHGMEVWFTKGRLRIHKLLGSVE